MTIILAWHELWADYRLGISSRKFESENKWYEPVNPLIFTEAFKLIPMSYTEMKMIDFGCGKGRALALATSLGIKDLLGIELNESLAKQSMDNLYPIVQKTKSRICIRNANASTFVIPNDINVFFFFNPFDSTVMANVIKNIRRSMIEEPREAYLVYVNPVCWECVNFNIHSVLGNNEAIIYEL